MKYFAKAIAHTKTIAFAKWPIFNIISLLQYLVLYRAALLHRITPSILTCFTEFKILVQIEYFAKAVAQANAVAFVASSHFVYTWLFFFFFFVCVFLLLFCFVFF